MYMSITYGNIVTNNIITSTASVNTAILPTTAGTTGQFLISGGSGTPTWGPENPFNQSLNTTNSVAFTGLTVGNVILPTSTITPNQYLQSNGSSATTWTVPKANIVSAKVTSSFLPSTSNNPATKNWSAFSGLSVSITPLSTSSKILIMVNLSGVWNNGLNTACYATIFKNGTDLSSNAGMSYFQMSSPLSAFGGVEFFYVDSPATTSAITYAVYCCNVGANNASFNQNGSTVSIVAYEI